MDIQPSQYEIVLDKLNFDERFVNELKRLGISIPYYILKKALGHEER